MARGKYNILFLQPRFHNPSLPNFKDRFEMLSEYCEGHVIFSTHKPEEYDGLEFGDFVYHASPCFSRNLSDIVAQIVWTVRLGIALHRHKKFDWIHCYDAQRNGVIGMLLKWAISVPLIVEVNGCIYDDIFFIKKPIKKFFTNVITRFVLGQSDSIKVLNSLYEKKMHRWFSSKPIFCFPTFAPTHFFHPSNDFSDYIFFVGHPFYLKGVDVLIKAFLRLSSDFPDVKLKIIGYCRGGKDEKKKYADMTEGNVNIEILDPVYFDEIVPLFEKALCFVLPSRSEAMGRVLIEAMSAGKPVIGSRVGGIPDVIEDGRNGFLFESENIDELEERMRNLLSSEELRQKMGQRSLELVQEKFSSQKYVENFISMIEG